MPQWSFTSGRRAYWGHPRYRDWTVLPDALRESFIATDVYVAIPDVQHSKLLNAVPR